MSGSLLKHRAFILQICFGKVDFDYDNEHARRASVFVRETMVATLHFGIF